MQAITVAISPAGIQYFAQAVLEPQLTNDVKGLTPQSQTINVGTVNVSTYDWYNDIVVHLTGKSASNFSPQFQPVTQAANGAFPLVLTAANFKSNHDWHEAGTETKMNEQTSVTQPYARDFSYSPTVKSLHVTVNLKFYYQSNAW